MDNELNHIPITALGPGVIESKISQNAATSPTGDTVVQNSLGIVNGSEDPHATGSDYEDFAAGLNGIQGQKCEFRAYQHVSKKNGTESVEVLSKPLDSAPINNIEEDAPYAMVINRYIKKNKLVKTTLRVNSPHLLKTFQEVIGSYPGISPNFSGPVELSSPFQMLFHYWEDLEKEKNTTEDPDRRMHLNLLFQFMQHEMGEARKEFMEMIKQCMVKFENVWCLFRPDELLYTTDEQQPWLMRCVDMAYKHSASLGRYLEVNCTYTDHNGKAAGIAYHQVLVVENDHFAGEKAAEVTKLRIFPCSFLKHKDHLIEELELRGRKYQGLQDSQIVTYSGTSWYLKQRDESFFQPGMDSWRGVWLPYEEAGKVILDRTNFRKDQRHAREPYIYVQYGEELDPKLCPPRTLGYSVALKSWCKVFVDRIQPVQWKENVWQSLILPEGRKLVLKALVKSHAFPEGKDARDETQQKGKGLVVLLQGTAGSGKTFTAETAAEECQKALIATSSGELNKENSLRSFEARLKEILRLATIWKAIVLLDEADVFLEARDINQVERNALVAVFLRQLEYFSGIVFLTTNRVSSFDEAMKSRIHLSLEYSPPTAAARHKLWQQNLRRVPEDQIDANLIADISSIASAKINGREISNAVNTAWTVARFEKTPLKLQHLKEVLEVRNAFEHSLKLRRVGTDEFNITNGLTDEVEEK